MMGQTGTVVAWAFPFHIIFHLKVVVLLE